MKMSNMLQIGVRLPLWECIVQTFTLMQSKPKKGPMLPFSFWVFRCVLYFHIWLSSSPT